MSVDENLFYKGVDKSAVHGARLNQTHSLSDPSESVPEQERDPSQPPYPYHVSISSILTFEADKYDSLERACLPSHANTTYVGSRAAGQLWDDIITQMTIAQIVYDNELHFGYADQEVHDKVGLCLPASSRLFTPPNTRVML